MKKFFCIFILLILCIKVLSQNDSARVGDSLRLAKATHKKNYSGPRRASIMSTLLPGLGQASNRKYWKIPVIYAGLGGFGYMFYTNNTQYNDYRKALITSVNHSDSSIIVNGRLYSQSQLQTQKLYYRKYRDFAAIGVAIIYVLNIIDANVDAHLKTFDVSDDLSIQIRPWQTIYPTGLGYKGATGITVKLNFK